MSLANSREQRSTAGNRLTKLLEAEEEDEFYKTTYGGFNDESGDDEYHGDHSDTEDEVDSDFDLDEGDEPDSEQEEETPRRRSRILTKAYREPIKVMKPRVKQPSEELKPEKPKAEKRSTHELQELGEMRKSVRKSTSEHTRKTFERLQERQQEAPRRRKVHRDKPLSQEELLREAEHTAQSNLESLENYERLEADKKKHVQKKRRFEGPTIRYHSVLMMSEPPLKDENVDVEGLDQDTPLSASVTCMSGAGTLCSRTFITFSDEEAFESAFPQWARVSPDLPVQEVCPVTHNPALYRDPVTDIPYADARAFRIIREAYRKYMVKDVCEFGIYFFEVPNLHEVGRDWSWPNLRKPRIRCSGAQVAVTVPRYPLSARITDSCGSLRTRLYKLTFSSHRLSVLECLVDHSATASLPAGSGSGSGSRKCMIVVISIYLDLNANINYTIKLDAKRQSYRAYFSEKIRELSRMISVSLQEKCDELSFSIEACPNDALNPIINELVYTFEGLPSQKYGNLRPMLLPTVKYTSDYNGRLECVSVDSEEKAVLGETTCYISKPIFKKNDLAVFDVTYNINKDSNFEGKITINATASRRKKEPPPNRSVHISQRELQFTNTGNSTGSARRERAPDTNPEVLPENAHRSAV
ncbi:vacuolar protein sorting-associated protein 72-like [Silurus meridionalis]|nr:vacuolar protein sorting-associated protein 72-like [Silurus meridionalis]